MQILIGLAAIFLFVLLIGSIFSGADEMRMRDLEMRSRWDRYRMSHDADPDFNSRGEPRE